jgi:hypothetical protein
MNQTLRFFQHLHRAGAYAYYHCLPERRSYWYPTSAPLAPPGEATTNWYISVHPSSAIPPCNAHGEIKAPMYVRAQKRYVAALNCLYGEFDVKTYGSKDAIYQHIAGAPWPAPSVVVDSGGGVHAYWLLREPWLLDIDDTRQAAEVVQRVWVQQVIGADPTVHDLVRILRVPGTLNFKYDPPPPVQFVTCNLELHLHGPGAHGASAGGPRSRTEVSKRPAQARKHHREVQSRERHRRYAGALRLSLGRPPAHDQPRQWLSAAWCHDR